MQTYKPRDRRLPSAAEILLRTIHSQCAVMHAVTRDNLLKFETPGIQLPGMAVGEQEVKTLVCLCLAGELYFQLNTIFS